MRGARWGLTAVVLVGVLAAGCSSSGQESGTATAAPVATATSSKTIDTQSRATISRTVSSQSTSTSSASRTSSSTSTTSEPGPQWDVSVKAYPIPAGLLAVSPVGGSYAARSGENICIFTWEGAQLNCPVPAPAASQAVHAVFSSQGNQLAVVVVAADQKSNVFLVDMTSGTPSVLTDVGMVPLASSDPAARLSLSVSGFAWDRQERDFYVQQLATAETGELIIASTDGAAPVRLELPADIANGYPQMLAIDSKVVFSPTTGPQVGTLWQLTSDDGAVQVGTGPFNPAGAITLVALDPGGRYAMFCTGSGTDLGELHEIDLNSGEDYQYLKDDEGCIGTVYSDDGDYIAVVGPLSEQLVLSVLDVNNDDVPVNEVLNGSVQAVPARMTWTANDVITVVEGDVTDKFAKVNLLTITR